jgi:hypothetical protein
VGLQKFAVFEAAHSQSYAELFCKKFLVVLFLTDAVRLAQPSADAKAGFLSPFQGMEFFWGLEPGALLADSLCPGLFSFGLSALAHSPVGGRNSSPNFFAISFTRVLSCRCCGLCRRPQRRHLGLDVSAPPK